MRWPSWLLIAAAWLWGALLSRAFAQEAEIETQFRKVTPDEEVRQKAVLAEPLPTSPATPKPPRPTACATPCCRWWPTRVMRIRPIGHLMSWWAMPSADRFITMEG